MIKRLTPWSLQYSDGGEIGNNLTNILSGTDKCSQGGKSITNEWSVTRE